MREIWKDIEGFENLYQVSNLGNVRSLDSIIKGEGRGFPRRRKGRVLKPQLSGTRYYFVNLAKEGKNTMALIHRLVAFAFIPTNSSKMDVNHIDGNKLNNRVKNLEWCTRQENIQHAFKIGLAKPHHNQINKRAVEVFDNSGFIKRFDSIANAANFIGVSQSGVSRVCSGRLGATGGYKCRFI